MKLINPDIGCLGIPSHSRAASQQRFLSLLTGEGPEKLLGAARGIWSKLLPVPAGLPACTRQGLRLALVSNSISFPPVPSGKCFPTTLTPYCPSGGNVSRRGLNPDQGWSTCKSLQEGTHTHTNTRTHVCTHMQAWRSGGLCLRHYLRSFFLLAGFGCLDTVSHLSLELPD